MEFNRGISTIFGFWKQPENECLKIRKEPEAAKRTFCGELAIMCLYRNCQRKPGGGRAK
jgi:hypothetical protein